MDWWLFCQPYWLSSYSAQRCGLNQNSLLLWRHHSYHCRPLPSHELLILYLIFLCLFFLGLFSHSFFTYFLSFCAWYPNLFNFLENKNWLFLMFSSISYIFLLCHFISVLGCYEVSVVNTNTSGMSRYSIHNIQQII